MADTCTGGGFIYYSGMFYFIMYTLTVMFVFWASDKDEIILLAAFLIVAVLFAVTFACCVCIRFEGRAEAKSKTKIFVDIVIYVWLSAIPVWHVINFAMLVEVSDYDTSIELTNTTTLPIEQEFTTTTPTSTMGCATTGFSLSILILVTNTIVFVVMIHVDKGIESKGYQRQLPSNLESSASQETSSNMQDNKPATLNVHDICKGDLYHYTNTESAKAIIESGKINASISGSGDAVLGSGVYFTPLPPSTDTELILKNNYGTISGRRDRVQSVFKISANELPGCKQTTENRQVVLYPDSVDLQKVNYDVISAL